MSESLRFTRAVSERTRIMRGERCDELQGFMMHNADSISTMCSMMDLLTNPLNHVEIMFNHMSCETPECTATQPTVTQEEEVAVSGAVVVKEPVHNNEFYVDYEEEDDVEEIVLAKIEKVAEVENVADDKGKVEAPPVDQGVVSGKLEPVVVEVSAVDVYDGDQK